jgi:hypothetical protein
MTDDQLKEWASRAASEIVKREGAALALPACDRNEPGIEADSNLLGIANRSSDHRGLSSRRTFSVAANVVSTTLCRSGPIRNRPRKDERLPSAPPKLVHRLFHLEPGAN